MTSIPLQALTEVPEDPVAVGSEIDAGILSRALLGKGAGRFDRQLDLLASAWLAVLIAAIADYRAGLFFVVVAFCLTAISARTDTEPPEG